MLARRRGRVAGIGPGDKWANPGPGRDHVAVGEVRIGEVPVRREEQIAHVGAPGPHLVRVLVGRRVGRADDRVLSGWKGEHSAAVVGGEHRHRPTIADARGGDGDVHALRAPHRVADLRPLEPGDRVSPGSAGTEDEPRLHAQLGPTEQVADDRAIHGTSGRGERERRDLGVIDDRCTRVSRVDDIREREPGIIGAGVPVERAALEVRARERRLGREHAVGVEPVMAPDIPEQCEGIVERERRSELPALHSRAAIDRPGEAQRLD